MIATKLKIRIYGDPCLRKKSLPVKEVGAVERILIAGLIETMCGHKGIGLAAPQVGINEQIFVADIGEGPLVFVNPRISKRRGMDVMEEGCLSIPGVTVKVSRPQEIFVTYLDENNHKKERECDGMLAKVVQHETDHLRGKLIIDYAGFREKFKIRKQLLEIRRANKINGVDGEAS